ncbi:MAG: 30S ribosome-binding factor RbfA [Deltaproteobacteria bacterium]|nr:MAG: 30S ribosome-binding factor RbfA [Deltaproteobacteria bacterium]
MSGKRYERMAHQLRDEISAYLQKGLLKDPRIGFATISGVRVSKDLRHAKVFVSVFGSEEEGEGTLAALQSARNYIRRQLGKDLHIRRVPELTFFLDDSIAEGVRISKLINEAVGVSSQDESAGDDDEVEHPVDEADLGDEDSAALSNVFTDWAPIVQAIQEGQTFLLSGHRHPDGDSMGATTALFGVLQALGKEVVLFNDEPLPEHFHFLPHASSLRTELEPDESFDVTILCDCGSPDRAPQGFPGPEHRGVFVVIDHHQTSKVEGDINYNDPTAAAVGLLIYELCQELGVTVSREIGVSLYTALMSDTGSFRYDKTNAHVMRVAADLLEVGVRPWEISSALYESSPLERQKLLALALDTLDVRVDGKLATIHITGPMFEQTGSEPNMTDGFINYARGIKGVEVAVMFREQEGGWKLSFRSRGSISVADIASQLGGGGHRNAAGAFLTGSLEDIKQQVCESLEVVLRNSAPSLSA